MTAWVLFLLCAGFVLYVLFGYPLLLAVRARLFGRPVRKQFQPKTVTLLLAVRNGEPWIRAKLESVLRLNYPRDLLEILVISDGSEDRTDEITAEFQHAGVQLLRIRPQGKAAALNEGIGRARGEILFFTDVRQSLEPDSLRNLVASFADPDVGAASGELVFLHRRETHEEANVSLYWRYEKWIRRRLSQIDSVPGATGCIYAMRRELAVPVPANALLDDVCLPLAAYFQGYRVIWDDSAKAYDYPTSLDQEFRRKVRTQAGVYQLLRLYPQLLGPRNRMWLDFMSHKLGRLFVPYALILIAVSSFWLPAPWSRLAQGIQMLFYGLAVIDYVIPEKSVIKWLSSPVRTFVVLMAAAFYSTSVLLLPEKDFWRQTKDPGPPGETE